MRDTVWKGDASHLATVFSLVLWTGVCVYYAIVEEFMTTVAHIVAFGVGAGALLIFSWVHQLQCSSPGDDMPRVAYQGVN